MSEHESSYISGTPSLRETVEGNTTIRTYLWETPDKRKIYLHLTLTLETPNNRPAFLVARSNIDSSEVKGQGQFIWDFLVQEILNLAEQGLKDVPATPILHEVRPNKYSLHLVENDHRYTKRGDAYYALFT